jgi:invasion protein IalB
MTRLLPVTSALLLLAVGISPATAQRKPAPKTPDAAASGMPGGGQATLVATFNDWSAYTAQSGKAKICYALSQPKSRTPANLKDTPAYLFVSFRPAENVRNEVATVLGFDTKETGAAEAAIGSTSYALVTKGKNGWIKNPAEEGQAIATMSKGQAVVVTATSARGNKTGDRYSLAGFAQALDRAKKECP